MAKQKLNKSYSNTIIRKIDGEFYAVEHKNSSEGVVELGKYNISGLLEELEGQAFVDIKFDLKGEIAPDKK